MGKFIKYVSAVLIALSAVLTFWAIFSTPEEPTVTNATAIGANLYWAYALLGLAIVVAIIAACWELTQKPEGLKGAVISAVAIIAIIVVSYVVANGHQYEIVDLNTQGFFGRPETVITDASILVTYVAFAAAVVAAIYSAVTDALK